MSNRNPRQNGRRRKDNLMTQQAYADAVGVSPGYVSKRTKNGKLIDGTWSPSRDAVVDEEGNLLGYTAPTRRSHSDEQASAESAQKAAGVSSGEKNSRERDSGEGDAQPGTENRKNGQARENPSGQSRSAGQARSRGQSSRGDGLEEAIEGAAEAASRQVVESPGALRGAARLGGAAAGAILAAELVGRSAGAVLLGTATGLAITEYSIQAEQTETQEPARQIQPAESRQLSKHNSPPETGQDGGQHQTDTQPLTQKQRLARERPGRK